MCCALDFHHVQTTACTQCRGVTEKFSIFLIFPFPFPSFSPTFSIFLHFSQLVTKNFLMESLWGALCTPPSSLPVTPLTQWSTACHGSWCTTCGIFSNVCVCDILWSTSGLLVDHWMYRLPVKKVFKWFPQNCNFLQYLLSQFFYSIVVCTITIKGAVLAPKGSKFEEKWGKWNFCPPGMMRLATALPPMFSCPSFNASPSNYNAGATIARMI